MENGELIDIWKAQDAKIEKAIAINQTLVKEIIQQKAESALQALIRLKTRGIITFVLYLLLLGYVLYYAIAHYTPAANYFIVSLSVIALINLKGFSDYIRHRVWAHRISYNGNIMEIQQSLLKLQLSIINHAKIMCLQFPFFTTLYLSGRWFPSEVGVGYLIFQTMLTGSFVYLSYWLYQNHSPKNLHKKWFQRLLAGSGGKPVAKAIEFYQELEDFRKD